MDDHKITRTRALLNLACRDARRYNSRMRSYAVAGAGAVGSALAAYLAQRGHSVLIVGRERHVQAIHKQGGLRVVSPLASFLAEVEARTTPPAKLPDDTILFLTVQAPDVLSTLKQWTRLGTKRPIVTWQNGVRAEATARGLFEKIYGGVVRFTSTVLEPGEVRLRAPGTLILGRYPHGRDSVSSEIVGDLRGAGFHVGESPRIMEDKALKLLVNLVSGPAALVRRTQKEPVLAAVQAALLEEAIRVFGAAGVLASAASGIGQSEDELLAHFHAGGSDPDTAGGVYNSTWQNLHHGRERLENEYYHGEIIRLGKEVGVPTPVNARTLEVLETVLRAGRGPEVLTPLEFRKRFEDVVRFPTEASEPVSGATLSALEI